MTFIDNCPDCTNRAPVCPACWDLPGIDEMTRCPCQMPGHLPRCGTDTLRSLDLCAPSCQVELYIEWLHAKGGVFRAATRPDTAQPTRDVLKYPEGEYFTLGLYAGLCGCGCEGRLNHGSFAVRRGVLLYLMAHDPAPACQVCHRPVTATMFCDPCWQVSRSLLWLGDALADHFAPRPAPDIAKLFRRDEGRSGKDALHAQRLRKKGVAA